MYKAMLNSNTLLDYSKRWKQFEICTDVKRYPSLGTTIISISVVKTDQTIRYTLTEKEKLSIL